MRVGLGFELASCRLYSASGFEVVRSGGEVAAHLSASVIAKGSADGVELNALDYAGHAWTLRPVDAAGAVSVNGKEYRGGLTLIHTDSGRLNVVNNVDLESYIAGVLAGEVPASWPEETLKAQAVAARSYAMHRISHHSQADWDMVATDRDQVYDGIHGEVPALQRAVAATNGEVLTYQGEIIKAYFHASCGGHTESARDVFGEDAPYLEGVPDPYCEQSPYQQWNREYTIGQLRALLEQSGHGSLGTVLEIRANKRNKSGRVVEVLVSGSNVGEQTLSGVELRRLLGYRDLRSTAFDLSVRKTAVVSIPVGMKTQQQVVNSTEDVTVGMEETEQTHHAVQSFFVIAGNGGLERNRAGYAYAASAEGVLRTFAMRPGLEAVGLARGIEETKFKDPKRVVRPGPATVVMQDKSVPVLLHFSGRGWGHGVGLCQWGARGMASQGFGYRDILQHYYPGTTLMVLQK